MKELKLIIGHILNCFILSVVYYIGQFFLCVVVLPLLIAHALRLLQLKTFMMNVAICILGSLINTCLFVIINKLYAYASTKSKEEISVCKAINAISWGISLIGILIYCLSAHSIILIYHTQKLAISIAILTIILSGIYIHKTFAKE